MDEQPIGDRIEELVAEEHRLWSQGSEGGLDAAAHERLAQIRTELDQCWDHLRRRRANPGAPDRTSPPAPDPPNELEGPEPEPPHLEHGVHGDGPAPDPDIPRNLP